MSTIVLEPELYNLIQKTAQENRQPIGEMISDAVQQYLWELNRKKISDESVIYRQHHAELKAQYLGQYIAMRNGQVIDHDADFQILYRRVAAQFPDAPVMMTLVEDEPDKPILRRGFRMEGGK